MSTERDACVDWNGKGLLCSDFSCFGVILCYGWFGQKKQLVVQIDVH